MTRTRPLPDMIDDEPVEPQTTILSEEKQPDGSVIIKLKEKTSSGYQIRTLKKVQRQIQVRKGVIDRKEVFSLFILFYLALLFLNS